MKGWVKEGGKGPVLFLKTWFPNKENSSAIEFVRQASTTEIIKASCILFLCPETLLCWGHEDWCKLILSLFSFNGLLKIYFKELSLERRVPSNPMWKSPFHKLAWYKREKSRNSMVEPFKEKINFHCSRPKRKKSRKWA